MFRPLPDWLQFNPTQRPETVPLLDCITFNNLFSGSHGWISLKVHLRQRIKSTSQSARFLTIMATMADWLARLRMHSCCWNSKPPGWMKTCISSVKQHLVSTDTDNELISHWCSGRRDLTEHQFHTINMIGWWCVCLQKQKFGKIDRPLHTRRRFFFFRWITGTQFFFFTPDPNMTLWKCNPSCSDQGGALSTGWITKCSDKDSPRLLQQKLVTKISEN